MSWLRRKPDQDGSSEDPRIDYARQVAQNPKTSTQGMGRGERATDAPRGVDSDFCYNEDSGRCA